MITIKQFLAISYFIFLSFTSESQTLNVKYKICNGCCNDTQCSDTGPISNFSYQSEDNYKSQQVSSDFAPRPRGSSNYDWHGGIDLSSGGSDSDKGDLVLAIEGGTIVRLGGTYFKYIVVGGDHYFGYGHIFSSALLVGNDFQRSGNVVFKKRSDNPNQFAIIFLDESPVRAIGLGGTVEWDDGTTVHSYNVTNTVSYNEPVTSTGDSQEAPGGGAGDVDAHLHLFLFANSSINFSDGFTKNPLEVLTYPGAEYSAETEFTEKFDQEPSSFMTRMKMMNQTGAGNYSKVQDANLVVFSISPTGQSVPPNRIESKTHGYISLGGRLGESNEGTPYPSHIVKKTGKGGISQTGIDPHAYRQNPWDDYYYSDFYTRTHLDNTAGNNILLAGIPKKARYEDGKYNIIPYLKNIRGIGQFMPDAEKEIEIDNFFPYIEGVNVYFQSGNIVYTGNYYAPNCLQPECHEVKYTYTEPPTGILEVLGNSLIKVKMTVLSSEALNNLDGSLNDPLGILHTASVTSLGNDGKNWQVEFSFVPVIPLGEYEFWFEGEDRAGNQLLNFDNCGNSNDVETIPYRKSASEWEPMVSSNMIGQSKLYKFRLGSGSCTPTGNRPARESAKESASLIECECEPYAEFTATPLPGGYGYSFDAATQSAGTQPLEYNWSFGNQGESGSSASNITIEYEYAEAGEYDVVLTVTDPCGNTATATHTIYVEGDHQLSVEIVAPETGLKNQTIPFDGIVSGGIPPYTYQWSAATEGSPEFLTLPVSGLNISHHDIRFQEFTPLWGTVYVTVTDASGNSTSAEALHQIVIEETNINLEIWHFPSAPTGLNCDVSIPLNSYQLWTVFISPVLALDPPLEYNWDFGDGTTITSYEPGGQYEHSYTVNGNYTIKVKVCNVISGACYEATREVCAGTPEPASVYSLTLTGPSQVAWGGSPAIITFNGSICAQTAHGSNHPCNTKPLATWSAYFPEANFTVPTSCSGDLFDVIKLNQESEPDNCILEITYAGEAVKPWGCLSVTAYDYKECDSGVTGCTPPTEPSGASNPCIVYITPPPLKVSNIQISQSGSCSFKLSGTIADGARKIASYNPQTEEYEYEDIEYEWKAFNYNNPAEEIEGFFVDNTVKEPVVVSDHPYFSTFSPTQSVPVIIKFKAVDLAGQIGQTGDFIFFNPFRISAKTNYSRCPETWSYFENQPIAGGGTSIFEYTWSVVSPAGSNLGFESDDIHDSYPYFRAPASGSKVYLLQVKMKDAAGNVLCEKEQQITVNAAPLTLTIPSTIKACSGNGATILGPSNPTELGGSGWYGFQWSTDEESNLALLSDIFSANPVIQHIPEGQTIIYTLLVGDLNSDCTSTATVSVTGFANNVAVQIPASYTTCNRSPIDLVAKLAGAGIFPAGYNCEWTYPTFPRPDRLSVGATPNILVLNEIAASHAGTFPFTARIINAETGCYGEGTTNITILDAWKYQGYEPVTWFAVAGTKRDVWNDYTTNEIITPSPAGNSNPLNITWNPVTPTDVEWNGGSICCRSPRNGSFTPTTAQSQLMMHVEHGPTGCAQDFKSIRYILGDSKMDLTIMPKKSGIICEGENLCYNISFNMHLLSGQTSFNIPQSVKVRYSVAPPSGSAQQTKNGFLDLPLQNNTGLYTTELCVGDYFMYEGTYLLFADVQEEEQFGPQQWIESFQNWNAVTEQITATLEVEVSDGNYGNLVAVTNCLGTSPLVGTTYDMGLLMECQQGAVHHWDREIRARSYIEIHPDAMITLIPEADGNKGAHLRIDPCIPPLRPESEQAATRVEEKEGDKPKASTAVPGTMDMDIQPNPFNGKVTLIYSIPVLSEPQNLTVSLYDFTGKFIVVIDKASNISGGTYQMEFSAKELPPGVYFYEVKLSNGMSVIKRGIKI